jgi:RNA polymerase sigma-70 factor (ECF subfamily)
MMLCMALTGGTGARPGAALRPSDAQWGQYISAAAAGKQEALASLYDESSRLVYSIAFRILNNAEDAEEVTLEVYAQIWRQAGDYSSERGTPSTWLVMLARSRALDRVRSRDTRRHRETPLDEVAAARSPEDPPEQAAFLSQRRTIVRTAMMELAPEQREAIELSFFSGLTHTELAEKLGQPLGTVKTRIRLGMIKLRQSLTAGGRVQ